MYAIKQNQDEPEAITANLKSIVPHIYGQHDTCDQRWCHHTERGDKYSYKSLPYGKPLTNADTRVVLESMIKKYVSQSQALAQLGSTQAAESFHNMVAARAPKAR